MRDRKRLTLIPVYTNDLGELSNTLAPHITQGVDWLTDCSRFGGYTGQIAWLRHNAVPAIGVVGISPKNSGERPDLSKCLLAAIRAMREIVPPGTYDEIDIVVGTCHRYLFGSWIPGIAGHLACFLIEFCRGSLPLNFLN